MSIILTEHTGSSLFSRVNTIGLVNESQFTSVLSADAAISRNIFRALSASVLIYYLDGETPVGSLSEITLVGTFLSGPLFGG